ncbi:MAG: RloB family protein [Desulfovibrio sp.]|jgi:hypothetical protein|nr:RloB family protein [Desulfovibrio sp.]
MPERLRRPRPTREYRKTVYIFCNGHTEKLYFSDFIYDLALTSVRIVAQACEYNRISLVKLVKSYEIKPDADTEVWIVFDVDDDPGGQTNEAVALCKKSGYRSIVSNECFEVWFRLHFDYFDSAMHRSALFQWMSQRFGRRYEKNKTISTYPALKGQMPAAIRNAKRLAATYANDVPHARRNPYTNVYKLVEALLALKDGWQARGTR